MKKQYQRRKNNNKQGITIVIDIEEDVIQKYETTNKIQTKNIRKNS